MKLLSRTLSLLGSGLSVLMGGSLILLGIFSLDGRSQLGNLGISLFCVVVGGYMAYDGFLRVREASAEESRPISSSKSVEDRLDELERLKRRDMVTPEEYAIKRQDILKDL